MGAEVNRQDAKTPRKREVQNRCYREGAKTRRKKQKKYLQEMG